MVLLCVAMKKYYVFKQKHMHDCLRVFFLSGMMYVKNTLHLFVQEFCLSKDYCAVSGRLLLRNPSLTGIVPRFVSFFDKKTRGLWLRGWYALVAFPALLILCYVAPPSGVQNRVELYGDCMELNHIHSYPNTVSWNPGVVASEKVCCMVEWKICACKGSVTRSCLWNLS